jgi:hypothetical protein
MDVLKERYVKKCGKEICGSGLYVSSFILLKTQYFFKNNYKIGLLKQKSALKTSINIGLL